MTAGEAPTTVGEENRKSHRKPALDDDPVMAVFHALASLKLTVFLFACAILLVLFGTLAQVDYDVWHVVRKSHFRVPIAWIDFKSIGHLLHMVFGGDWSNLSGSFPFPGGVTIGAAMFVNLLAAHAIRFKATARGSRLTGGIFVIALGVLATFAVIVSGGGDSVKSDLSNSLATGLWHSMRALLAGAGLAGLYWLVGAYRRIRLPEWIIAAICIGSVVGLAGWLFMTPEARLDNAGLRILWYVVKASASTAILLVGCLLVFGKRAGIVLLHGGVGLLMLGELATYNVDEGQMRIAEGETVNYATDIRTTELALTDPTDPDGERVAVVPQHYLENAADGQLIQNPQLPVDLRVLRFDLNSTLVGINDAGLNGDDVPAENPATAGAGQAVYAAPEPSVSGLADAGVNLPSVYVEVLDKESGKSAGVYLASVSGSNSVGFLKEQQVTVGDKTYGLALRFKRLYKDYAVELLDFTFGRYQGTNVAKDYRSEVRLLAPDHNVDRQVAIYMNNPLRYGGDTLYQADFDKITERGTVLQVVTNGSWMVPYVSCIVVAFGMLAHFSLTLGRFLRRRADDAKRAQAKALKEAHGATNQEAATWQSPLVWAPVLVGVLWGGYLLSKARPAKDAPGEMRTVEFGALPLTDGGRLKPYDSLARNTLQFLSARQEVLLPKEPLADDASISEQIAYGMKRGEKLPAIEWMLDLISTKRGAGELPVFRIENLEVLDLLGLEHRTGSFRYCYNEIMTEENKPEIGKQLELLGKTAEEEWTTFQSKMAELGQKLNSYHALGNAFAPLQLSSNPERIVQDIQMATLRAAEEGSTKNRRPPPRPIPPTNPAGSWLTYSEAQLNQLFRQFPGVRQQVSSKLDSFFATAPSATAQAFHKEVGELFRRLDEAGETPAYSALAESLRAYAEEDSLAFNAGLKDLEQTLEGYQETLRDPQNIQKVATLANSERISLAKAKFEAFFTHFSPFYYCAASYLIAFILCALSWLVWPRGLGRAATAIIFVTFLVHTFALVGRIYITSRPPITNLYSSAVFVGWAIVLAGLAIEAIYKMGVGSVLASVFGFLTLVIAHFMALDGDTFTVLQAVLDTQFWLATHVVAVTLGYVATFVAGGLGVIYIVRCYMTNSLPEEAQRALPRMIYGTLCFAILFSFVGTVLGGLWGDNSWGRFWGWDPKENGALIIVLWNALVLHARWGGMISSRGLAALAVAGNICTTWSWFGTNELGVGLHAYGGLSDGVSLELLIIRAVFYTHPLIIAAAFVPRDFWRNLFTARTAQETE